MTEKRKELREGLGLLVLRLGVGGMMFTYGWPKLQRLLETPEKFADPLGLGPELSLGLTVFAELVCAGLLVLGAWTRLAAFPLLVTMAVAVLVVHGGDPFKKQELALLYGAGAFALMCVGAGRFSVDNWLAGRRQNRG